MIKTMSADFVGFISPSSAIEILINHTTPKLFLGVELHFLFVTQPVVLVEKVPSPSFLPGIKEAKEYVETRGGIFRLKNRGSFFQLWRFVPFCNRRYLCLNSFRHA